MSELDEHNEAEQAALLEKGPLLILKALTFELNLYLLHIHTMTKKS